MQCILLAAGNGERMRPLTDTKPKALVPILGKPLIEHIVDTLPDEIDELVVVVGYKHEQIEDFMGESFLGRSVRYVFQKEKQGTARALLLARPFIKKGKFMMLYADDLHSKESLRQAIETDLSVFVYQHEHPERFGAVSLRSDGTIEKIIEKPTEKPATNLVTAGGMILDERIFNYQPEQHRNGEYYLVTMADKLAHEHPVTALLMKQWIPIGYPEDIERAEKIIREGGLE